MLSASILALTLAAYNLYLYAMGTLEEGVAGSGGIFAIVHDPILLTIGAVLLGLACSLGYVAFRIKRAAVLAASRGLAPV